MLLRFPQSTLCAKRSLRGKKGQGLTADSVLICTRQTKEGFQALKEDDIG